MLCVGGGPWAVTDFRVLCKRVRSGPLLLIDEMVTKRFDRKRDTALNARRA
jgi:hypothetical protein